MKLYGHPVSPYTRKARVIAHELGMTLELIQVSPPLSTPEFRRINPLGKIPALVMNDGSAIFDSPVICEYLNDRGGGKFFPGNSLLRGDQGKWRALTLQGLGDGLADAAVAVMGERRTETPSEARISHHMAGVEAALNALERIKLMDPPTIGEIAVACALGYVDFRLTDLDWKASRPKLSAWYQKFCDYPSMQATAPDKAWTP